MLRLGRPRRVKIRGDHTVCGCGGIGRRARFRFLWGQLREGSSPFTRTKKTRGRKTSGFFVGEDLNLVPSEQVPRRLGNMVARGAPQVPLPALPISFGRGGENRPPDAFHLVYLSPAPNLNSLNFFTVGKKFGLFCFLEDYEQFKC